MKIFESTRLSATTSTKIWLFAAATALSACVDDEPGIETTSTGGSAAGHNAQNQAGEVASGATAGTQGEEAKAGTGAVGASGPDDNGGSTATGGTQASQGGDEPIGGGDDETNGGATGAGGANDEGVHIEEACVFHSDPVAPTGGSGGSAGTGGSGGSGGAANVGNITVQVSAFVGSYLADNTGRALYTYGADLPGDCNTPPQSLCTADCLVSWPVFDAGARVLPDGLTDAGFGTIPRAEGGFQTTYMGWPLYYYNKDLTLGQLTGQGKGKTWHIAKVKPHNVVIMKAGTLKYLADAAGHTLYVSAADEVGGLLSDPVSNCGHGCLQVFEGFRVKTLSPVTSLESLDFSVFARHGAGGLQTAYKGMPLYRAATDVKSGDMTGTAVEGFTAAVP